MKPEILDNAFDLFSRSEFGILSTTSVHLEGFPFGSVLSYCLDGNANPITLISTIAQHTKNVAADSRVSLTVLENKGVNVQAEGRITISGHLAKSENQMEALETYQRYFPESKKYMEFHDFEMYTLKPTAVRYIGGFGQIHWIEPKVFFKTSSFSVKEGQFIIDHMNDHHADSLKAYSTYYLGQAVKDSIAMVGIDDNGIDLLVDSRRKRISSPEKMTDSNKAREVLVAMSKEAMTS